jgi:ADP-heptose:LPS heptosyltransferase
MIPRILVSLIGLNRVAGTRECVDTLLKIRTPDIILHLTNNGSTDGTGEYFDEVARNNPGIIVVHNKENRFFQEPNEQAYAKAVAMRAQYFLLHNDDLIPYPGMFDTLLAPFKDPMVAITGPSGGCNTLSPEFHGYSSPNTDYVEGSLMMFKISIMQQLRPTLFWPRLTRIYGEDSEVSLFVRERGYKLVKTGPEPRHARSQTVNRTEEVRKQCMDAQEHNHNLLRPRWGHYLRTRKFDYPIVIKRKLALGDVLLATPIIRLIKEAQPQASIVVETNYPEVLKNHPLVRTATPAVGNPKDALIVDLNMAYENRTDIHICDAYMDIARGAVPALQDYQLTDKRLNLFPGLGEGSWAVDFRKNTSGMKGKLVLIHAGPTSGNWPGKEWPMDRWAQLATWLVRRGCHVAVVGKIPAPWIKDAIHLEGKTSIHQLAALAQRADLAISIDSLPLHVFQAMNTPTVALFGVTSSKYIITNPERTISLDGDPNDGHTGLRHKVTGRMHFTEGHPSIAYITLDAVKAAVEKLLP